MPSLWLQYTYYWTYFTEARDDMSTVCLGESRRVEGSENTLQNKCISKKKKKVKVESEKVGLRLNIQKTKIMASGPYSQGQAKVKTRSNV